MGFLERQTYVAGAVPWQPASQENPKLPPGARSKSPSRPSAIIVSLMPDLTDPRAIKLKGALFLILGLLSAGLLLAEAPTWRTALLLGICIWSFCRLYYFAFYVIQHYVDPGYRFAGLGSFLRYMLRRK
jgi:hypothetical protein